MTNSDAFAHFHRTRASKLHKQLGVARLQLDAAIADLEDMLRANRIDEYAPGSGLAGGGRSTDVSDPTGNTAIRWDTTAEKWGAYFGGLAHTVVELQAVTWARQSTLADPAPTGLCRHGDCPDKRVATRGVKARDGMPRCEACYTFWLRDVASPDDPVHQRQERQRVGQSPRWIGFPAKDREAVA